MMSPQEKYQLKMAGAAIAILLTVSGWLITAGYAAITKINEQQDNAIESVKRDQQANIDRLARMETKIDMLLSRDGGWQDAKGGKH